VKRKIERADILDMATYGRERAQRRAAMLALKADRRLALGPHVTMVFETFDTMLHQIHEMLYIEKGGEEQIAGEIEAYSPLVPRGDELVATMLIEIEDPGERKRILATLGRIEDTVAFKFGGETVTAFPDEPEKTDASGKTSSVHFLHFRFTPAQIAAFREKGAEIVLAIGHPNYRHMTVLSEKTRAALAGDFD